MRSLSPRPDVNDSRNAHDERDPAPGVDPRWALAGMALRVAAEAGFFALVYACAAVLLDRTAPLLGPAEFILLVGLGAVVSHFGQDNPELGALGLIIAVLGAGIACWLASPAARDLLTVDLGAALTTHGIGWIGAVALLRGSFIRGGTGGAFQLELLLRSLLPVVALLWAATTLLAPRPLWPSFAAYALWGTLALVVCGLAGIGLVRLRVLHAGVGDAHVRQLWRWLVLAAAIVVVPLSVPFAILAGVPVDVLLSPLSGPVIFIIELLLIPVSYLLELVINLLMPVASNLASFLADLRNNLNNRQQQPPGQGEGSIVATLVGITLAVLVILVFVVAIYLLAHWVLSRNDQDESEEDSIDGAVEHAIVVPEPAAPRPRSAARRRRGAAHDAVGAYVSAIDELAAHPDWARVPSETPAEHSLRVRAASMPGSPAFSRLAADYQLARYAERPITAREDRRALSRLDRFRRALRSR